MEPGRQFCRDLKNGTARVRSCILPCLTPPQRVPSGRRGAPAASGATLVLGNCWAAARTDGDALETAECKTGTFHTFDLARAYHELYLGILAKFTVQSIP